jgi:serine/threonine protein kinase
MANGGTVHPSFGERALLQDEPRTASVRVLTPKATVLVLHRDVFLNVVRPRKSTMDEEDELAAGYVKYEYPKLKTIGLLGCGGFGKVTLVRDTLSDQYFALKMLSKGHIMKEKDDLDVMNEKRILRMTHSPFLIQLAATFNLPQHLAFLLEPATGGELFTLYSDKQWYGKENYARFYSACVLKGLEHLHRRSIIYRDMKLENLLLDTRGYCKITDFGLAKFAIGKTFTTCGTPEYFAPELLKGCGHTQALDWWTFGVLIFEFMTNATPFQADEMSVMIKKINQGIDKVPEMNTGQKSWKDLVKSLCKQNPSERLPVRPGGTANIMNHRWYQAGNFDWESLAYRTMPAPWNPGVTLSDLSNFDASEEDAPPNLPYKDPKNGWDAGFEDVYGPACFDLDMVRQLSDQVSGA